MLLTVSPVLLMEECWLDHQHELRPRDSAVLCACEDGYALLSYAALPLHHHSTQRLSALSAATFLLINVAPFPIFLHPRTLANVDPRDGRVLNYAARVVPAQPEAMEVRHLVSSRF